MKSIDLELLDPIGRDRYQVQVKAKTALAAVEAWHQEAGDAGVRRHYFVVHSPGDDLRGWQGDHEHELVLPERLAEMVVNAGLTQWLES